MKAYILIYALVVGLEPYPSEDVYQEIDETGVRLGAYFGCYETKEHGLVCVLPDKPEKQDGKEKT